MEKEVISKLILSGSIAAVFYLIYSLVKLYAKRTMHKKELAVSRYLIVKKILALITGAVVAVVVIYIWGMEIRSIWVSVTGLLAMVAIAFFAVWSLIGNILAGILLYFSAPFKIGDSIEIAPEGIKGKVVVINTFFTMLQDEDGSFVNIPNSLFFQKYIKVACRKRAKKKSTSSADSGA